MEFLVRKQLGSRTGRGAWRRPQALLLALAAAAIIAGAKPARATVISYEATGTSGGNPVDALATITTGTNSLTVVLTNLEAAPTSIGQSIAALLLSFSTTPTSAALNGTPSGQLVDLVGGVAVPVSGSITRWSAALSSGKVNLTALSGGQPTQLIVGPGPYPSGTGGFDPHQPHVWKTATFNLTVNGINSTTNVTAAKFAFGTGPDANIAGKVVRTPEPMSLALLGSAVAALGFCRRKRRR